MSIASSLSTILTNLQSVLESINTALTSKGVAIEADTLGEVSEKIGDIETGITPTGTIEIDENDTYDVTDYATAVVSVSATGTPALTVKTGSSVTATVDSSKVVSFSGLSVSTGETLVGVVINKQGTPSTTSTVINCMMVLQNGSGWKLYVAGTTNSAAIMTASNDVSFSKSGETGGTVTITDIFTFASETYNVYPIVASVT